MPELTIPGYDPAWFFWTLFGLAAGAGAMVLIAFVLMKLDIIDEDAAGWLGFWPVIGAVVTAVVLVFFLQGSMLTHDRDEQVKALLSEGFVYPEGRRDGDWLMQTPEGERVQIDLLHLYGEKWTYKVVPVE